MICQSLSMISPAQVALESVRVLRRVFLRRVALVYDRGRDTGEPVSLLEKNAPNRI